MVMRILFGTLAVMLMPLIPGAQLEAEQQLEVSLPASATGVQPKLVGSSLLNIGLRTATGDSVDLVAARGGMPSVLVIYRGGW